MSGPRLARPGYWPEPGNGMPPGVRASEASMVPVTVPGAPETSMMLNMPGGGVPDSRRADSESGSLRVSGPGPQGSGFKLSDRPGSGRGPGRTCQWTEAAAHWHAQVRRTDGPAEGPAKCHAESRAARAESRAPLFNPGQIPPNFKFLASFLGSAVAVIRPATPGMS